MPPARPLWSSLTRCWDSWARSASQQVRLAQAAAAPLRFHLAGAGEEEEEKEDGEADEEEKEEGEEEEEEDDDSGFSLGVGGGDQDADLSDAEASAFPDGWDAGPDCDPAGVADGAQPPAKQARHQVDQSTLHRAIACATDRQQDAERMRRELDEERDKARERSPRLQHLLGDVHILAPAAPLH